MVLNFKIELGLGQGQGSGKELGSVVISMKVLTRIEVHECSCVCVSL